jgi:hypothetical protein
LNATAVFTRVSANVATGRQILLQQVVDFRVVALRDRRRDREARLVPLKKKHRHLKG